MNAARLLLALALPIAITACVPPPTPPSSREEAIQMTTRFYSGVSPEKVLTASERILKLADEGDVTFQHGPDFIRAQRHYTIYMVLALVDGYYIFDIRAVPKNGGTEVNVSVRDTAVGSFALPTSNLSNDKRLYSFFFARLDYMLGKRKDWLTCADARKTFGDNSDALCLMADDKTP